MPRLDDSAAALRDELVAIGRDAGLDAVGFCMATPFVQARTAIESRKASGLHAGMGFTFRQPAYSTTPTMALREARAIVVGALAYRRHEADSASRSAEAEPLGRVAAYAWEEYYAPLKAALGAISARLRADSRRTRVVVDDNALVDRAAAMRAGLGWQGKNANVLLVGRGSWFVLGSVLTDAALLDADPAPVADGCGTCARCIDACPTAAIISPGVLDARRCLSWLLQAPGIFPREHRVALGDRIYGCDDCQEVCPPNRLEDRREHPAAGPDAHAFVSLLAMLEDDEAQLLARHGSWYIAGRDARWLRRNALLVLANTSDACAAPTAERVRRLLARYLAGADTMLAAHAVWATRRLGHADLVALVAEPHEPEVRAELAGSVPLVTIGAPS